MFRWSNNAGNVPFYRSVQAGEGAVVGSMKRSDGELSVDALAVKSYKFLMVHTLFGFLGPLEGIYGNI